MGLWVSDFCKGVWGYCQSEEMGSSLNSGETVDGLCDSDLFSGPGEFQRFGW